MAGSRRRTLIILVIAIPVVLMATAVVFLRLYFTEERLKEMVLPRLESAVSRPVTLERISLSLIPRITVSLGGLTIANRQDPGFSQRPMVSIDELIAAIEFLPLLRGDVRMSTLSLRRPRILLEVNGDGTSNYSETTGGREISAQDQPGSAGGILLADAQITDGTLEYLNHKQNSRTVLDGINYTIEIENGGRAQNMKIQGSAAVDDFSYGTISSAFLSGLRLTIEHTLGYSPRSDSLMIERGTGSVNGMPLLVSGFFAGVSTERPYVNLVVTGDNLGITDLFSLIPREYMGRAPALKGEGDVRVRVQTSGTLTDSTQLSFSGQITSTNARVQFIGFPKTISNITIAADFERSPEAQRFRMSRFSAVLGENPVDATMTIVHFDDPRISMTVDATLNLAEIREYYPLEEGVTLSGAARARFTLDGKINQPSAMNATGSLSFRDVSFSAGERSVERLNGAVSVSNALLQSNNLGMKIGGSDLNLSFRVRNYLGLLAGDAGSPAPTAVITLTSHQLRTEDILTEGSPGKKTSVQEQRTTGPLPFPSVTMDISASIRTLIMEKFTLENVRSSMRIAGAKVTLNDFTCNAFEGNVLSRGEVNLQDAEHSRFGLSFDISSVNGHTLLSEFTSFGSRIFGTLSVKATMQGSLDDTLGLRPETLEAQGTVGIREGKLAGVQVNREIASRLSLPSLEEVVFSEWSNGFIIREGRLLIRDLTINGSQADYTVNGSQGLDGTLDYTVGLVLPLQASDRVAVAGFAGDALNMFKGPDGRFRFDFGVTGTMEKPAVALQTEAARKRLEEMARQKLTEERKRLEDQAKKKGEELLDKLFKKK
jgi:AsmA-like C-terminal region/AsmA family/Protein of unknown function